MGNKEVSKRKTTITEDSVDKPKAMLTETFLALSEVERKELLSGLRRDSQLAERFKKGKLPSSEADLGRIGQSIESMTNKEAKVLLQWIEVHKSVKPPTRQEKPAE